MFSRDLDSSSSFRDPAPSHAQAYVRSKLGEPGKVKKKKKKSGGGASQLKLRTESAAAAFHRGKDLGSTSPPKERRAGWRRSTEAVSLVYFRRFLYIQRNFRWWDLLRSSSEGSPTPLGVGWPVVGRAAVGTSLQISRAMSKSKTAPSPLSIPPPWIFVLFVLRIVAPFSTALLSLNQAEGPTGLFFPTYSKHQS